MALIAMLFLALSSLGPAIGVSDGTGGSRKRHENKYGRFSRAAEDPLEQAMSRVRNQTLSQRLLYRGTTVPIDQAMPKTSQNSSRVFSSIKDIVPSDPSTFGYAQIGVISGTHGVRGEVKVRVDADFTDSYLRPGNTIYIKKPNRLTPR